jgi:hypothetical protein
MRVDAACVTGQAHMDPAYASGKTLLSGRVQRPDRLLVERAE